ncbi:Sucrose-6-phosphate hydrolase SacC, GH32 family [Paenibacillus sophorae]|uniref:beta-fructofuranosidase n=1 Tax=Paenibacillus sophorae TaxID=1333845 RepID=A0A1H8LJP3_9BACL|nr:GH32 C-terminal domain-containing protein [Paenibacillus sophorae]QWU17262.1 GH32 C-terminal domain-containing protein [Paenibacillus sophorae]SEO05335.1 Sucrose-6-phosphate hydrolase SacC, GH32 family [Paenibacillus sophorae]
MLNEPIAYWTFDEGRGNQAADSVSGKIDTVQFALSKGRFQAPRDPVWAAGVKGKALSFDGYSTFIRRPAPLAAQPSENLTITAWVAPRTYDYGAENRLAAIVNQHNREGKEGYILGLFKHGAWSLQAGTGGEWLETWSTEPVPLHRWSFVCAVFAGSEGRISLYLNGRKTTETTLNQPLKITPGSADLLIGRNNDGVILAEAFVMNNFDGWMDELAIYDRALTEAEIQQRYEQDLRGHGGVIPSIDRKAMEIPRQYFAADRHRPQYHMNPPGHWMNEPHAPLYFEGQYHLFYQQNPQGPFYHYIHWGHAVSPDLVHWRDLPAALSPESGLDPDGIWSGSASYDHEGLPVLFYTIGNNDETPNQSIGLARSSFSEDGDNDLKSWIKHPIPIIRQERGTGLFGEFRDPFVWKEDGIYYMLVGTGAGGQEEGGTALVYTSSDMLDWEYRGPLYISDYGKYPYLGKAWELPVLLPLPLEGKEGTRSGKHVLLISPWGEGAKVEVNYWIGVWDPETCKFQPDHEEPGLIDVGDFHFTGPSGMVDPRTGRSLVFTIAQGERTPEIDYDCGWAHGAGMPVSLFLRTDGRLGVEPVEETALLRGRRLLSVAGSSLEDINRQLAGVSGDMLEIILRFNSCQAEQVGISLRRSLDGAEETVIRFNRLEQRLEVDRTNTTLDARERTRGIQGGDLPIGEETLRLHIFVDRSLIECYANGLKSLTTRAYPSRLDALGLLLWSGGPAEQIDMDVWEMGPAYPSH